jgi:hypothetical protein
VPLGLGNQRQNLLDEFGFELSKEVVPVVGRHPLDQRTELVAVRGLEQVDLPGERIVGKDLGLPFDRDRGEQPPDLAIVESFGKLRDRCRVEFLAHLTEPGRVAFGKHHTQLRQQNGVGGGHGVGGAKAGGGKGPILREWLSRGTSMP